MSPETNRDHFGDADSESGIRQQLAALDGDLLRGLPSDDRLSSGVPDGQRSNSLDFIQMTGLTRPPIAGDSTDEPNGGEVGPAVVDGDPDAPLSFYEAGVADVDEDMGGGQTPAGLRDISLDTDLIPNRTPETLRAGPTPSARAFEDIIARLEQRTPAPPGDDADTSRPLETGPDREMPDDAADRADDASDPVSSDPETEEASTPEEVLEHTHRPSAHSLAVDDPPAPDDEAQDDFDALVASLSSEGADEETNEPDTGDATEDWDRLLEDAITPEETAKPYSGLDLKPRGSGALAEAEQLMQALGKTRPVAATPAPTGLVPTGSVSSFTPPSAPDLPPSPDFGRVPPRRRSRRPSRISRKARRLVKMVFLAVVFGTALTSAWYFLLIPALEQPVDLEARAERLMAERKYREASATYSQLARYLSPDQAEVPNAQFHAAYALTLGPEVSMDDTRNRYEKAIGLFNAFVEQYPQHPKRTRAQCIVGRLYYQLQDYEQAISVLRDQVKPVDDPAAALTILRYLARSYAQLGKYEEAETAYLQAATLPDNYSAETDYLELGDLFGKRAGLAEDPAKQKSLEEAAVAYWNRALQVPGIDPTDADILKQRLEWRSFAADSGVNMTSPENPSMAAESDMPAEVEPPAVTTPPADPVTDTGNWIEDPAAEIGVLLPPATSGIAAQDTDNPTAPTSPAASAPETEPASVPEN